MPDMIIENLEIGGQNPEVERLTILCDELRREIKWQGAEFDQIDAKMGVALGFVLLSAGQLLSSLGARLPDGSSFLGLLAQSKWMHLLLWVYVFGLMLSVLFGSMSRWPSRFRGSFYCDSYDGTFPSKMEALVSFEDHYRDCLRKNKEVLSWKDFTAKFAYAGVGVCLLALALLIAMLLLHI